MTVGYDYGRSATEAAEARVHALEVQLTALWARVAEIERRLSAPNGDVLPPLYGPIVVTDISTAGQGGVLDEYDALMSGQPGWIP